MLAACSGEVGSGAKVVGYRVKHFGGGQIVGVIGAADDNYGTVKQGCSRMPGARRGHCRPSGNTSRLRIVNLGCVQRVRAIGAAAGDKHAAILQNGRSVILARRGQGACVRKCVGVGIEDFKGIQRGAGVLSASDEHAAILQNRSRRARAGIIHVWGWRPCICAGIVELRGICDDAI